MDYKTKGREYETGLLILLLILAPSCSRQSTLTGGGGKPAAQQTATPFPESNEAPGWVRSGETRMFTPENLYEYIDGGADKFIQAGLKTTKTQDYRYQNKLEATADIYTMNASESAKKMFASESSAEGQRVAVGDTAQLSKGSLLFVKGAHYVKLVAYQQPPEAGKALTELAQAIERKLAP